MHHQALQIYSHIVEANIRRQLADMSLDGGNVGSTPGQHVHEATAAGTSHAQTQRQARADIDHPEKYLINVLRTTHELRQTSAQDLARIQVP